MSVNQRANFAYYFYSNMLMELPDFCTICFTHNNPDVHFLSFLLTELKSITKIIIYIFFILLI